MISRAIAYNPRIIAIEDTGAGTGLIEELRRASLDSIAVYPSETKLVRAQRHTPMFQSGRVLFPRDAP